MNQETNASEAPTERNSRVTLMELQSLGNMSLDHMT